jgi:hypothetical protein
MNAFRFRRSTLFRAAVALLVAVGCAALAVADAPSTKRRSCGAPSAVPRLRRGGGPQTGTGTSDVVRTIVPPKSQG